MLTSQTVPLQSVRRPVANTLLGASIWTQSKKHQCPQLQIEVLPVRWNLLPWKPKVPIDFYPKGRSENRGESVYRLWVTACMVRGETRTGALGYSRPVPKLTGITGAFHWFWGVLDQARGLGRQSWFIQLSNSVKNLRRTGIKSWGPHLLQIYCAGQKTTYNQPWTWFWRKKMSCVE